MKIDNEEVVALSHLIVKEKDGNDHLGKIKEMQGDLEPLLGREWDNESGKGVGQNTKFEGIGLIPGSRFKLKNAGKINPTPGKSYSPEDYDGKIKIGAYGLWKFR